MLDQNAISASGAILGRRTDGKASLCNINPQVCANGARVLSGPLCAAPLRTARSAVSARLYAARFRNSAQGARGPLCAARSISTAARIYQVTARVKGLPRENLTNPVH